MKEKIVFMMISVFLRLLSGSAAAEEMKDAHKPAQHRHQEYTKLKNPVAKTGTSVIQGRKLYEKHCQSCHGESGKGGIGPDLTDPLWLHGNTDGEIFNVVTQGIEGTAMRGFEKELTKEMRWHLVNYLKSPRTTEGRR